VARHCPTSRWPDLILKKTSGCDRRPGAAALHQKGHQNIGQNSRGGHAPRNDTARVLVKSDDKIGGSIIDAEIAGQRTILTYRADLSVKKLHFRLENAELRNVQISALEN
jgi:hypothetical protein